jgi:N-acetylglucosamine malate deacetylase 1
LILGFHDPDGYIFENLSRKEREMNVDVLAIGAHPDDLELACGGILAKLVKQGYKVALADATRGELGTRGTKEIRSREAEKAAAILGALTRRNLEIPDGNVEISRENVRKVITLIRELRPSVLVIPHGVERHPDHAHTHQLCKEAWFYAGLRKLPTTLRGKKQEPHRPHHYFEFMQWHEFPPTVIVDISETFAIKMNAVRAHASQFFDPSSKEPETRLSTPSFLDTIETRCKYYGQKLGVAYGEPLLTPFSIGIADIFDLIVHKG